MMLANSKWRVLALLLCSVLTGGGQRMLAANLWQASAVPAGQLQVAVTDQNGQLLGLVLIIAQQNEKTVAEERTSPSGNATLRQLAPGTYKVLIEKQGFYTSAIARLVIVSGQQVPLEVRL